MTKNPSPPCPCGSGKPFAACCGPCLDGSRPARDAETLMRSRYTAFTRLDEAYLLATWHPDTRPPRLDLHEPPLPRWLGLAVKRHEVLAADRALVEFVARYKIAGRAYRLHETSRFALLDGEWLYMDGEQHTA